MKVPDYSTATYSKIKRTTIRHPATRLVDYYPYAVHNKGNKYVAIFAITNYVRMYGVEDISYLIEIWVSDNSGTTWELNTTLNEYFLTDDNTTLKSCLDANGNLHILTHDNYRQSSFYYFGRFNSVTNTWSFTTTNLSATVGDAIYDLDFIVYINNGITYVHIVKFANDVMGVIWFVYTKAESADTLTPLDSGIIGALDYSSTPTIDFEHTGDGLTPKTSPPNIHIGWFYDDYTSSDVYYRKGTPQGGTWVFEPATSQHLSEHLYNWGGDSFRGFYNGKDFCMCTMLEHYNTNALIDRIYKVSSDGTITSTELDGGIDYEDPPYFFNALWTHLNQDVFSTVWRYGAYELWWTEGQYVVWTDNNNNWSTIDENKPLTAGIYGVGYYEDAAANAGVPAMIVDQMPKYLTKDFYCTATYYSRYV